VPLQASHECHERSVAGAKPNPWHTAQPSSLHRFARQGHVDVSGIETSTRDSNRRLVNAGGIVSAVGLCSSQQIAINDEPYGGINGAVVSQYLRALPILFALEEAESRLTFLMCSEPNGGTAR
jgi:hypothetical protein